ncbi:MAG: hypothetical protein K6C68_03980 [Ruminococcus sp.]|nr:hypothetical protein [Ruminococcus sp.]
MKQVFKEIKEQLSPDDRTVNGLIDRINGREPAVVKTGGFKWAVLMPLTAALGIAILSGMISLSSNKDIELDKTTDEETKVVQLEKEYGYPAAQVKTPVEAEDGKFDFKNGGYYSMEKHQPKDPPDEETKKRLLKQNTEITIYNNIVHLSDGNVVEVDCDTGEIEKNVYHADDETFETFYHVSRISSYLCMGKVKDGDRIYELLVGYTGFGPGTVAISFGDGRYYLYRIPNFDLELEYAGLHLALGEEHWGDAGVFAYNDICGSDQYDTLTDELFFKIIDYIQKNDDSITVQIDDDAVEIRNGVYLSKDDDEQLLYKYGGMADRTEFDDSDVCFGFGTLTYSAMGGTQFADYNAAINSPAEDGSLLVLLPGDRVIKLIPVQTEE